MSFHRLVLGAALLSCCTGETRVRAPSETVLAFAGEDVVLPCSFNVTARDDFPTVEWSKEGLHPNVIFLYRHGCETYEMKNPAFEYRTSLITKELKNRNISLRISNVQLSDGGKYQCMRLWSNSDTRDITTLELVVGAVSEPKLSFVSSEAGEVTLQCEATCWQPEPLITFLDDQGNIISAEDLQKDENISGCYTVRRTVTLQTDTNRVTCRVHQPNINQTRNTEILIPAVKCLRSCSLITGAAVGATAVLVLLVCGLSVFMSNRCHRSVFLEQRGIADTEQLRKELAELKFKIREQEKIILQQQNDLKLWLSPVGCQHSQPIIVPHSVLGPNGNDRPNDHDPKRTASTSNPPNSGILLQNEGETSGISRQNSNPAPDHPVQRKHRINSSPAVLNLTGSYSHITSKKIQGSVSRSNSDSRARRHSNTPKDQRNRFFPLTYLSEETETLLP
ncbi:hypothetical protein PAMA_013619 [Pampus argenteus]